MPRIAMAGASMILAHFIEGLRFAGEHGFEAFEIFAEFPQCVPDEVTAEQRAEAREIVERHGMEIIVHAPFTSLNIASLNAGIRLESVRQQKAAIELCADLGGKVVVLHNGKYVFDQSFLERHPEAGELARRLNIESLKKIAEAAEKRGVTLALENIAFELDSIEKNPEDMLDIRDAAGGGSLFFTLDIGHARLSGGVEKYISVLGEYVRHIHFTDNFGEHDDHVVIGEGSFDYTPFLDFIRGFPHTITLEVVRMSVDGSAALTSRDNFLRLMEGS